MANAEKWRPVVGYEGLYEVSNLGRVRSVEHIVHYKDGRNREFPSVVLMPARRKDGYLTLVLKRNGCSKNVLVHRLVASAFIDNENELPCVNHKDEDKNNNCAENLEWCTHKYNINYGTCIQRGAETRRGKPIRKTQKLLDSFAARAKSVIGTDIRTGEEIFVPCMHSLEKEGIKSYGIVHCCKGDWKTYHGFKWRYAE